MKIRKQLYDISKKLNKTASLLGDIEAVASLDPDKMLKRFINKKKNKLIYKGANKISRKVTRK